MNAVRRSGLKLLAVAGALTVAVGFVAMYATNHGWQIHGYGWGVPGAFALAGLVQVVSGVPFSELSSKWDGLEGWQRGVLGTLIFVTAVGLIFVGIFIFVTVAYGT
jgi:hypothetical protein